MVVEPSSASLFVDGRRFDGRAHLSDSNLLNLATDFYLGAVPEETTRWRRDTTTEGGSRRAIIGCVDRVRIRGRPESWRTVLTSSLHTRTGCNSDLFSCNRSSSTCPVTGQKHSVDDGVSSHMTSISVVEGGRAALSTDLIGSISVGTLPQFDIRFRTAAKQRHGRLVVADQEPEGDQIEFSFSDVAQSRVLYIHDGSETTSDSIRLYVVAETFDEDRVIPVNIIPSNDPPVVRLPPNDTLTLVSNTKIRLNSDLLSAVDPDDDSSSLEFGVYLSNDAYQDSGYFELAASSGVRAKITRFTQQDVESGRVFYVHRGTSSHSFLLDATDGKDTSGIRWLTVRGLPLAVTPVINTGSSVPRGGTVVLGADMLSFATNAPYLDLDIRYQVVEPPFHGELQKLIQYQADNDDDVDNRMWTVASSFTQTQIDESRVRYVHDHDAIIREDYFLFRVLAVGAGQRAESEVEYNFRLTVVECSVDVVNDRPVYVQTVDQDQLITSGELRYVSSIQQHTPDDVIYRVRSPPRIGDLFLGTELDPDRRILTSGDSFTQADVENGRLMYRMYPSTDAVNDTVELDVVTSCASRRRHFLFFYYQAATGSTRLINVGLSNVAEGGSAVIGPEILNVATVDEQPHRNFQFSITRPTQHGVVQLMLTGSRNGAVSKSNATSFSVYDITSGRVRYVHDNSETRNDSFLFTVSENISGNVISEPEVVFRDIFSIAIMLQNDNIPRRVNEAPLDVVFGVGRRLGPEHLKYVDADVDTRQLDFTWEADYEAVELVSADDRWTLLYHFTQVDVDSGRVYVNHYSGSENMIVLWVNDGLHFVTGSLVVRASEPFVIAGNGTALTVVAGQSVVVSTVNFGFVTNVDVDPADIVFQVCRIYHINICKLFHNKIAII